MMYILFPTVTVMYNGPTPFLVARRVLYKSGASMSAGARTCKRTAVTPKAEHAWTIAQHKNHALAQMEQPTKNTHHHTLSNHERNILRSTPQGGPKAWFSQCQCGTVL
eukprot:5739366-Alexandrium_andersonii.AAC.1